VTLKKIILNWILIVAVLIITLNLNLNRVVQFIVIFVGVLGGLLLIEYLLGESKN